MAFLDVVFRALNKTGTDFVEVRREDGHGSTVGSPTYVVDAQADTNFDSVRIRKGDYLETEDVLYDIPVSLTDSFIYIGVAPAGTATSAATWYVKRISFNSNKLPFKDQFRSGVVWNNRAAGWT